jgi:hypothetical protein
MLTFLAALFAFGTLWFWLLLFIDFVIITALVENESGTWATIVAIGSILGLNYLLKLPILKTIHDNPLHTAELIALYFLLGAGWSIFKWWTFLHKGSKAYDDFKADFLTKNNAKALTPQLSVELEAALIEFNRFKDADKSVHSVPPSARQFKGDLTRWATYWPFSMVGFALNDVVRKAWNYVYDLLQSTYQRISNYMFRGAVADREMAANYRAQQELEKKAASASSVPLAGDNRPMRVRPNN